MAIKKKTGAKGWSKIIKDFEIPLAILNELGKFLVDAVKEEAMKDFQKQKLSISKKQGIPDTDEFWDSFSYKIVGGRIELHSSWPWIDRLIEGRKPHRMKWLKSQPNTPLVVPMRDKDTGQLIFRTAPLQVQDQWIHPGVARHTFIERAKDRMYDKAKELVGEELKKALLNGDPTK